MFLDTKRQSRNYRVPGRVLRIVQGCKTVLCCSRCVEGSARFSSCAGPARCSAHWSHLLLLCRTSIGHLYHDWGGVACPYQSVSEDKLIESCYFINGHSSCMETHDMFGLCMTLMNKSPKVHATRSCTLIHSGPACDYMGWCCLWRCCDRRICTCEDCQHMMLLHLWYIYIYICTTKHSLQHVWCTIMINHVYKLYNRI